MSAGTEETLECGCVVEQVDVPDDQWIGQGHRLVQACRDHDRSDAPTGPAGTGQCGAWLDANRCIKKAGHNGQHTNGLLLWGGTLRDRLGRAVSANEAANGSRFQ